MKVIIADPLADEDFVADLRSSFAAVNFVQASSPDEQMGQIADADVFFGRISREVLLAAPRLRWIHFPGTGIDWIAQVPELVSSHVILTNARGPHANTMADHVFAMVLALARNLRGLLEDQQAHRWTPHRYRTRMVELQGQIMGILGLGGIGMAVARRAYGFGLNVYAIDRRPALTPVGMVAVWGTERLEDVLRLSDWFVVTAPLTPETRGLIDRRRIGLMKPGAHIIVVSRAEIVDESALIDALRSGQLGGAALDDLWREPLPADNPLWTLENVLITPHVSASSPETYSGRRRIFNENLRRFVNGESLLNICNKQAGY